MKKRITGLIGAVLSLSMLTGCGLLTDTQNYNFNKDGIPIVDESGEEVSVEVMTNKNKTAEIYIDTTAGMAAVAAAPKVQELVQDSADAVTKTWNDVETKLYTVGSNSIDAQASVSQINNLAAFAYNGESSDVLIRAVENAPNVVNEKVIDPRIKLIVTDLSTQLQNYQELASKLDKALMQQNKSFAIISLETQKPFFIVAIGALNDLSSYLDEFYAMPNVVEFNPNMNWNTADQMRPINCKIYAQNSGIEGVNFDSITYVERGNYEVSSGNAAAEAAPPAGEMPGGNGALPAGGMPGGNGAPPAGGAPGGNGAPPAGGASGGNGEPMMMPGGMMLVDDEVGSYSILRPDYAPEHMKKYVEGTVNFAPEDYSAADIKLDRSVEVEVPLNVDEADLSADNIHYIGFKSLLWSGTKLIDDTNKKIAGKIKINIPFKSINQIQLSDLNFSSSTEYLDANKGENEFKENGKQLKENIEVAFASNEGPTESLWRIDNQDKTVMINIYVSDLNELSHATKLNITVETSDPGKIPVWVQTKTMSNEYKNLQSFISLLNDYHTKDNKYSETITVYLTEGDSELDESITAEPFLPLVSGDSSDDSVED